jgi:hypothetical protein
MRVYKAAAVIYDFAENGLFLVQLLRDPGVLFTQPRKEKGDRPI